ncbi:MAG: hypothetical protein RMJ56_01690 [Gemmataceae bacterium]|nr:hypothetical protein [Gemmata sp.]MDW8196295.1 hypothetical protein [Gemmataceae bacterium]
MRQQLIALLLLATVTVETTAAWPARYPFVRTAALESRTGNVHTAVTRVQPVVGSLQRTSRFRNPFTHQAKYTMTTYNPLVGSFQQVKFRR